MQWINSQAGLLDVLGNGVWQQFVDNFLQIRAGDISGDDVVHLFADDLNLGVLGVAGFALGLLVLLGEANAEDTKQESISSLAVDMAFNQCLPLLNHGSTIKIYENSES